MKVKQAIQLGNNITDIFNLPCVRAIDKIKGGYIVFLNLNEFNMYRPHALKGEWLCQYDNGKWFAISDRGYQSMKDEL